MYARRHWRRRDGLTGILDGTSSLRPRGLARENGEKAAGEEILIRDRVVVVVAGSGPDDRCLCSGGPTVECGGCRMQVTGWASLVVLINKTDKVGLRWLALMGLICTRSALNYSCAKPTLC
jgi:hypothetical protein